MSDKLVFNMSASSYSQFLSSPLIFYYDKILKAEPDTETNPVYGLSGNIVHSAMEKYVETNDVSLCKKFFEEEWERKELNVLTGFNNKPLNKTQYWNCMLKGQQFIDIKYVGRLRTEEEIILPFINTTDVDINLKGYIDMVMVNKNDEVIIVDWKTSSSEQDFSVQSLMYHLLYYKKHGVLPSYAEFVYLKLGKTKTYTHSLNEVKEFERRLLENTFEIIKNKNNINFFSLGDWDTPFNSHKLKCISELTRRNKEQVLRGHVSHGRLVFDNLPKVLKNLFITKYSFKEDGYRYTMLYKKGLWDGVKSLFRKRDNSLPEGLIDDVKGLVNDFNVLTKNNYVLEIMVFKDLFFNVNVFKKSDVILRPYQERAVEIALNNTKGILNLGTGCVDAETEFLTKDGWKKISDYEKNDYVLQYDINSDKANFVKPNDYIKLLCDEMYFFKTKYGLNQCLSPEHKMLYTDVSNGKNKIIYTENFVRKHEKLVKGFKGNFKLSYNINNNNDRLFSDNEIKLLTAIIADSSLIFRKNGHHSVCFNLKKSRKIVRLRSLLNDNDIIFKEKKCDNGYTRFYFKWFKATKFYNYLDRSESYRKKMKSWYDLSYDELLCFAEESLLWDGNQKNQYYSTVKSNTDFIQFCFNATNRKASIIIDDRVGLIKKDYIVKSVCYTVHVADKNYVSMEVSDNNSKINIEKVKPVDGFKYCFSVDTGFLVLRRNNCVFLTGNSGKTIIASEIIRRVNTYTLFLVNRIELLRQTKDVFDNVLGVNCGVVNNGFFEENDGVVVATIQSIVAIMKRCDDSSKQLKKFLEKVNLVLYDECQNLSDGGMYSVVSHYCINAFRCLGLTGSPFRSGNDTLLMNGMVGFPIISVSTEWLEDNGFLTPTRTFFIKHDGVATITPGSEGSVRYREEYDSGVVNNDVRNGLIFKLVSFFASKGLKVLVLTRSVAHCKLLSGSIIGSVMITGSTDKKFREEGFDSFKNSDDVVLVGSSKIFSAGVDIPDLDVIINAVGGKSKVEVVQSVGRVKRKSPGKKFGFFIDFLDNSFSLLKASRSRMKVLREFGNEVVVADFNSVVDEVDKIL